MLASSSAKHVDVVVAAADRAKLLARLVAQRLAVLGGTASHDADLEQRDDRPARRPARFLRPIAERR